MLKIEQYLQEEGSAYSDELQALAGCDDHSFGVALNRLLTMQKIERRDEHTKYTLQGVVEEYHKVKYVWIEK